MPVRFTIIQVAVFTSEYNIPHQLPDKSNSMPLAAIKHLYHTKYSIQTYPYFYLDNGRTYHTVFLSVILCVWNMSCQLSLLRITLTPSIGIVIITGRILSRRHAVSQGKFSHGDYTINNSALCRRACVGGAREFCHRQVAKLRQGSFRAVIPQYFDWNQLFFAPFLLI